jgi:hypothetical protein
VDSVFEGAQCCAEGEAVTAISRRSAILGSLAAAVAPWFVPAPHQVDVACNVGDVLRAQAWPHLDDVAENDYLSAIYKIRDSRWFLMVTDHEPFVVNPDGIPDMKLTESLALRVHGTRMSSESAHAIAAWVREKTA